MKLSDVPWWVWAAGAWWFFLRDKPKTNRTGGRNTDAIREGDDE